MLKPKRGTTATPSIIGRTLGAVRLTRKSVANQMGCFASSLVHTARFYDSWPPRAKTHAEDGKLLISADLEQANTLQGDGMHETVCDNKNGSCNVSPCTCQIGRGKSRMVDIKAPVLLRAGPSPKKRRRFLPYVADEDSLTWCRVRSEAIQSSKRIANWIKYLSVSLQAACTAREALCMYRKSIGP